MSDYEELIKNLRSVKDTWQTQEEEWMLQAADAIEKLMALTATAPQEMSAREYEKAIKTIVASHDLSTLKAWQSACEDKNWEKAVEIIEEWTKEHSEERSEG